MTGTLDGQRHDPIHPNIPLNTMTRPARPTDQPQPTEASPSSPATAEWTPPQDAQDRQQHRAALAALKRGTPVLIHRGDGRPPAIGWSWVALYDKTVGLIRGPEGQQASVSIWLVQPAPVPAA